MAAASGCFRAVAFQFFWAASEAARALHRVCAPLSHKAVSDSIKNWSPNGLKVLFSREVRLRVQSARSGCCLSSGNLSTELLRKNATYPGLSRILQHLARQRRAGFLLQGWLLSSCTFLFELPCLCCCWGSPATHTQLRLWKVPPALRAAAPPWSWWKCALEGLAFNPHGHESTAYLTTSSK